MGVHTLLIWSMSPTISDSIRLLIDGGANGGLAGTDICMLQYTKRYADIMGVGQA